MAETRETTPTALEEVTHAAFNGVLRAVEAREMTLQQFPGPIIIGLVAWPQLPQGGGVQIPGGGGVIEE